MGVNGTSFIFVYVLFRTTIWEFTFTQVFSVKLMFTTGFAILIVVQIGTFLFISCVTVLLTYV